MKRPPSQPHKQPVPVRPDTHAAALRAPDSPVRHAFSKLYSAAPLPLECAGLLAGCVGTAALINAAVGLLKQPTEAAVTLQSQYQELARACALRFEAAGHGDAYEAMASYKTAHPAWAAIVATGEIDRLHDHPAALALGVDLCLSLIKSKKMATAAATSGRLALLNESLCGISLFETMDIEWDSRAPHWVKHAKKVMPEFLAEFERAPPEPPAPLTFEERAAKELKHRAAFASYRRRAGILDTSCLSRTQIADAIAYGHPAPFASLIERKAAMWFVGMSGLFTGTVTEIPLTSAASGAWVMHYDADAGLLWRDYTCLAPEAARTRTGNFVPASYCVSIPAPEDVRELTRARARELASCRDVGDLIPALRSLPSQGSLFPCFNELTPSWAKWARTLGPFALQSGLDSMIAGASVGDIGVTAKSKLHYVEISAEEFWKALTILYTALAWGKPVPQPVGKHLSFGSSITTSPVKLALLDSVWTKELEALRPPNRLADQRKLIDFHKLYVRVLGARLCVWLSLRPAKELPVSASLDEAADLVIDIVEKTSAGREGGMPSVICTAMRSAIKTYRAHCKALWTRLRSLGWHGEVVDWLNAVVEGNEVPLLCEITSRRRARPIGTADVLELKDAKDLAPDFGRKLAENYLRRAGARWQDIDRHQRHEVKGQEQDTQVAEGSEAEWARRLEPFLQAMSLEIHGAPPHGLRRTEIDE